MILKKNSIIQEYEAVVESLQQDLKECKDEQAYLRAQIQSLTIENKNATTELREVFNHANTKECFRVAENQDYIEHLLKQIELLQSEKDSIFQLWQTSLKAVDLVEQNLKARIDGNSTIYNENQVKAIKETYSKAIKALETKLVEVRDNFTSQQTLWESSRSKICGLEAEKIYLEKQLINLQHEVSSKDESSQKTIKQLQSELMEVRVFASKIVARDEESRRKVSEALELVETAVSEKEVILERERRTIEEKFKLEARLENLSSEFAARLDADLRTTRENHETLMKNYAIEIKDLKSELRDKITLADRVQREFRMLEEELEQVKTNAGVALHQSTAKNIELEAKLKDLNEKLEFSDESYRLKYTEKLRKAESKILELEERISNYSDRLRRNQSHNAREIEDRLRESDERVKEAVDRYSNLEKRLSRALDERETLTNDLRSFQSKYDREISRRDDERNLLEVRIRELQEKMSGELAKNTKTRTNDSQELQNQSIDDQKLMCLTINHKKYEERIAELSKHVKTHQKLSSMWKEEAESLAAKFKQRYKELRGSIAVLERENSELKATLTLYRQQTSHKFNHGDGTM